MRIDRSEKIAGLDILKIRNAIRKQGHNTFGVVDFANALKVQRRKAAAIITELRARGWLETAEEDHRPNHFQTTIAGNAFAAANAIKPIPRAKAEKLLGMFLKRVEELNARDEFTHCVHEVAVFGSYNGNNPDVGDIDLAIDLRRRRIDGRDFVKYSQQRAIESGRNFRSFFEMLVYAEQECWRFLKARSPYISLHPISDVKSTGAQARVIYKASDKAGA